MLRRTPYLSALLPLILLGCQAKDRANPVPPVARVEPETLRVNGDTRIDNYYWLRERDNPEVLDYLDAENAYTKAVLAPTDELQDELFQEIKGRIKQDDSTPPYRDRNYYYYTRYNQGDEYPIYCRKRGSLEAPEEIILNVNELAAGHDYFHLGGLEVSEGENILAYAYDDVGRRIYNIRFKNLETGEVLTDEIPQVTGNIAWAADNETLFYSKQNLETLRWDRIFRHKLGTPAEEDVLVYEEPDDEFYTSIVLTKSRKYLLIESDQTLSSEYRYLAADNPGGSFRVIQPREPNHEYSVDHVCDRFIIRTNLDAKNFRLMETPIARPGKENWKELIPNRADVFLQEFEVFDDYLVLTERRDGLVHLRVRSWDGSRDYQIDFGEPAYLAEVSTNLEMGSKVLRYVYESMTTPSSIYDYDMETQERTLVKEQPVLGGFDRTNYVTERVFATARDGARVPVSIVYRKGFKKDGHAPLLLYGYGSYGYSWDPYFSSSRLSLLDRGFVFAIAHIRGGEEMGRQWYEDGKLLHKKNTFTDFIDVAEFLLEEGYGDPSRLFAQGGSAGGLLIGAVVNMRPDLFKGVVADVPFVDVVTTMLDDSIPLTTNEYDEWGNPNDSTYYAYMLSYSPYDNVEAKNYPNILVTAGLHDSQVQYWEPAKWVAKLRAMKTGSNLVLLNTNMDAGHSGQSGRFRQYKEVAMEYAFLLKLAGLD
ncbi:MAG: S9 family peptidase [Rhodothermales bacterium]